MDSITEGGQLLEEPRLSACLVLARSLLYTRRTELGEVRSPSTGRHANSIWNSVANTTSRFISCRDASEHFASLESNPFRRLSGLFRSQLVISLHVINIRDKGIKRFDFLELAARRFYKTLPPIRARADLDTLTRVKVEELAGQYRHFCAVSTYPPGYTLVPP